MFGFFAMVFSIFYSPGSNSWTLKYFTYAILFPVQGPVIIEILDFDLIFDRFQIYFQITFSILEKKINDVNDVKFKSVNYSLERHAKYHDDHFQEQKDLDEKITRSRESILKDVDDKLTKNSGTARSNISMLIAGAAVILTIIGLFIGLFR